MDFHPDEESEPHGDGYDYPEPPVDQSFEGGFLTAADEGFVSPPPQERKERRYSGMEIPFGVIEATSGVAEMNPMRNSKRLSTLGLFPSVVDGEVSGSDGDRSPVNDRSPMNSTNPLTINRRASLNPLSSRNKVVSSDEIPFGINESADRIGSEVNPMRTSAKYKAAASPAASPKKITIEEPAPEPITTRTTAFSFNETDPTTANDTTSPVRHNITVREVPIVKALSSATHIVLLFIYILFEILYELGLEAIKPSK